MDTDTLTSVLRILIPILGVIGIGGMLVRWIQLERFSRKNSQAAVETDMAVAYFKDPEVGHLPQGRASSSVHYITFHTDGGDIITLYMGPRDYYAIEEGARGKLTWQGARFWGFEPQ